MTARISFRDLVLRYQQRFSALHHYGTSLPKPPDQLRVILTLPAHREDLEPTLASLVASPLAHPDTCELIVLINGSASAPFAERRAHEQQAERYRNRVLANGLPLHVLTALDLPQRQAGVGLARKIAMDVALQRLAEVGHDGWIHCLDGDCTVSTSYWHTLTSLEREDWLGATLAYAHRWEHLPLLQQQAIIRYELFLRYYVAGLRRAAYPYAFPTIGSCMGLRASAYAKIGGMNRRKAGEDFYFLHKLMPHGKFGEIRDATVYPAARFSDRVPFGTGRAMLDMAAGVKHFDHLYHPRIFEELTHIHSGMGEGSAPFGKWLAYQQYTADYRALRQRSEDSAQWRRNFFFWWDGFKVLKYVHWRQAYWPDQPMLQALSYLCGVTFSDLEEALAHLRA